MPKNMSNYLQHLLIDWDIRSGATQPAITHENFGAVMHGTENDQRAVTIIGSPITGKEVNRAKSAQYLLDTADLTKAIKTLDGEFLAIIWNKQDKTLFIFNDRFSAYPLFWAHQNGRFGAAYSYMDLARHCKDWPGFQLLPERAYTFLKFRRLLDTQTHDSLTQALSPGAQLVISNTEAPSITPYWQPNFKKSSKNEKNLIKEFASLFEESVRVRQETDKTGIFLSGGHDSRTVALYADQPTTCFTLSFSDNLEVDCARKIAANTGHNHQFCQIAPGFFEKTHDVATELSAACYVNENALFFPELISPPPTADVLLHGHGLDYMYQGMYLHAKYYHVLGRHTYIRRFMPFPSDFTQHFIDSAPFQMKYQGWQNYLTATHEDSIHDAVNTVYQRAQELSDNPHDHWDYLILHNISKHHTYSNVLSKRTCGEVRTPAFDNALYDFFHALPHEYRLHGEILRGAMYHKNPKIANMISANHGLPAGWGPYKRTVAMTTRALIRRASFNTVFSRRDATSRTWPDLDTHIREEETYRTKALACLDDTAFHDLVDFIDWPKLKAEKDIVLSQQYGGQFFTALFSYYNFYKRLYGGV